ncbi:MAG: OmpA family protein [Crocinitomicaceae bacterium]
MRRILGILLIGFAFPLFSQSDTVKIGLNSYVIVADSSGLDIDSLLSLDPSKQLDHRFYKERYGETDLMYKITNNKGDGFDSLYGTRNMRPILHGVAYRGGANNYYHKSDKRKNQNPLPLDGLHGLCQEGFSAGIYLYRNNFEAGPLGDTCQCVNDSWNKFSYYQYDYYDSTHIYDMLQMTYEAATKPEVGPVYLHCWNGWHASGYLSAVMLKQFCGLSSWDAVNYWDIGTDGANTSPRYQEQREQIKEFQPYKEFMLSDSLQSCLCPPMPANIDSSQLHIEIEHLVVVPEAIPVGFDIVLYNVKFAPGRTSFPNISENQDIAYLKQALDNDPQLTVEIGGYTDNSGNYSKNLQLSEQRAKFVYDHLIQSGYTADRITYKGYGSNKPIFSNRYKSTREGNRRIEVKVINKTVHGGNTLVDESIYDDPNVYDVEKMEKSYLSYFLKNQGSEDLGSTYIVDSLIFDSGTAALPENGTGVEMLDQLVDYMNKQKYVKISINGYTDASGIAENNKILSEDRAKSVYDYLVSKGISASRIYHRGYGAESPIAPNRYKWGRDINRRIEIEFVSD